MGTQIKKDMAGSVAVPLAGAAPPQPQPNDRQILYGRLLFYCPFMANGAWLCRETCVQRQSDEVASTAEKRIHDLYCRSGKCELGKTILLELIRQGIEVKKPRRLKRHRPWATFKADREQHGSKLRKKAPITVDSEIR